MSYYNLLQENPSLLFLILLISVVVTLVVYSAFPLIFAKVRRKPITKKKYKALCYCLNFIGVMLFIALKGSGSPGPYMLWTWIFSNRGVKILKSRGYLSNGEPVKERKAKNTDTKNETPKETVKENSPTNHGIRFCRKCGKTLPTDAVFCSKCGTKIILDDK